MSSHARPLRFPPKKRPGNLPTVKPHHSHPRRKDSRRGAGATRPPSSGAALAASDSGRPGTALPPPEYAPPASVYSHSPSSSRWRTRRNDRPNTRDRCQPSRAGATGLAALKDLKNNLFAAGVDQPVFGDAGAVVRVPQRLRILLHGAVADHFQHPIRGADNFAKRLLGPFPRHQASPPGTQRGGAERRRPGCWTRPPRRSRSAPRPRKTFQVSIPGRAWPEPGQSRS